MNKTCCGIFHCICRACYWKPDGVPAVDIPVDVDLSNSDDPSLSEPGWGKCCVGIPWLANSFTSRGIWFQSATLGTIPWCYNRRDEDQTCMGN